MDRAKAVGLEPAGMPLEEIETKVKALEALQADGENE